MPFVTLERPTRSEEFRDTPAGDLSGYSPARVMGRTGSELEAGSGGVAGADVEPWAEGGLSVSDRACPTVWKSWTDPKTSRMTGQDENMIATRSGFRPRGQWWRG